MQKNKQSKVLLILPGNSLQVWSKTQIISNLTPNCDLMILTWNQPDSETTTIIESGIQVQHILPPRSSRITKLLQEISLIVYRSRSRSFSLRFERLFFGDVHLKLINWRTFCELSLVFRLWDAFIYLVYPGHRLISLIPILNSAMLELLRWIFSKTSSNFLNAINFHPELIVLTSSGVEPYVYELIRDAKRLKIKTTMVIENWDNLTSKSVIVEKPDYITVMGESSVEKARTIQKLDSTCIIPAGLPKHNLMRQFKSTPQLKRYPGTPITIQYLGFSVPHNEVKLINNIVKELGERTNPENWRFIYRPHPAKQARRGDSIELDSRVIVQTYDYYKNSEHLPLIDESYIEKLNHVDLIISTPTTMALEAMMLNKKVIIDGSIDKVHRTSAGFALKRYEHLDDLYHIKGLNICENVKEIVDQIILFMDQKDVVFYDLSFIVETSETCFSHHLNKIITHLDSLRDF
jgi:hypothetical protein